MQRRSFLRSILAGLGVALLPETEVSLAAPAPVAEIPALQPLVTEVAKQVNALPEEFFAAGPPLPGSIINSSLRAGLRPDGGLWYKDTRKWAERPAKDFLELIKLQLGCPHYEPLPMELQRLGVSPSHVSGAVHVSGRVWAICALCGHERYYTLEASRKLELEPPDRDGDQFDKLASHSIKAGGVPAIGMEY